MAVSIVRELKQVDIVEGIEKATSPRGWLMFDPLAAEATFPCTHACFPWVLSDGFPMLTCSGLLSGNSTDCIGDDKTFYYRFTYIMFLLSCLCWIHDIFTME